MEDKRISEKESLELIARMIRETQDHTARYAAYPLLIWGYTTVAISLLVWYFYLQTGVWQINFLWFALPVIAGPLTIFFNRKDKNKGAKNDTQTPHNLSKLVTTSKKGKALKEVGGGGAGI